MHCGAIAAVVSDSCVRNAGSIANVWADLGFALRRATVVVQRIAVVTVFSGVNHTVAADHCLTSGRAEVSVLGVAVVALFTRIDDSIAADCNLTGRTAQEGLVGG